METTGEGRKREINSARTKCYEGMIAFFTRGYMSFWTAIEILGGLIA